MQLELFARDRLDAPAEWLVDQTGRRNPPVDGGSTRR
jgi:hypothetical protein